MLDLKWTPRADLKNLYHWSPTLVRIPQIAFTYSSNVLWSIHANKTHATADLPVLEQKLSQKTDTKMDQWRGQLGRPI